MGKHRPKRKHNKIQHTKLILNIIIGLTMLVTLSSIYINLKNGFSMDGIVMNMVDALKWVLPSGMLKGYFETKEEKTIRLEYLKSGLIDEYDRRNE